MASYVGRFAPTPSGPLHFGSLVTALASYLDARAAGGAWLLRIDDLDQPRVKSGAEAQILQQLREHGLNWDAPLRRQSEHSSDYAASLDRLHALGLVYPCTCSRAQLQSQGLPAPEADEPVYPGTCRDAGHGDTNAALRMRLPPGDLEYPDLGLGRQRKQSQVDLGDFVLRRRDGIASYQLACAVDEIAQGITHIVRGSDLVSSTLRQRHILLALGHAPPIYRHLPLVLDAQGRKLSKRDQACAVRGDTAVENLQMALRCLGQHMPEPPASLDAKALLELAISRWRPQDIPSTLLTIT